VKAIESCAIILFIITVYFMTDLTQNLSAPGFERKNIVQKTALARQGAGGVSGF